MKTIVRISLAAACALSLLTVMPAMSFAEMAYPEKCKSEMDMSKMDMKSGDMGMGDMMTDYQKASMEGMKSMQMNMMQGMMKKDADVAFVCGMIAHHMGAISMSEVELKYGDNEWAKKSAQKIIDAQTKEIAEMTDWLDKEAK
ncbi:DUF305 domain-containing protein [Agrobacterium vitis]|jgi:uncharacterized protein (DUF305 family)|uniref:DUF305 domain-containing protein n=4 Tax=Rhizobium/Agrobacterium group TaxID=227290 RepID=B9K624_ALLAM|nr:MULTISPECIES: DUF305 domain-containing protein [Hyphomicrobiales]NTF22715.1 DUF305 domain-containing protein [Agrobacterium rubi]ACM40322.1 conserved hypothetical protein [Allorhizobium ampelinum S4]MDX8332083.1 DUF305 domain-containing protein [Agrobacterium rosae]MUO31646.1 DUF305 domain-containing protein [Agrobacterium vitis]MVA12911.1 DUF305 domain-containing protein [Agrobacterium vitis]